MKLIDADKLKLWFAPGNSYDGEFVLGIIAEQKKQEDLLTYQRGYEDGFREGRTRKELADALLPTE